MELANCKEYNMWLRSQDLRSVVISSWARMTTYSRCLDIK
jgi:hypothetical protein